MFNGDYVRRNSKKEMILNVLDSRVSRRSEHCSSNWSTIWYKFWSVLLWQFVIFCKCDPLWWCYSRGKMWKAANAWMSQFTLPGVCMLIAKLHLTLHNIIIFLCWNPNMSKDSKHLKMNISGRNTHTPPHIHTNELRGYYTPDQKLTCFMLYLRKKIKFK